jgi:hypothetical protein
MNLYNEQISEDGMLALQALKVFKILKYEQLEIFFSEHSPKYPFKVLNPLLKRQLIYKHANNYVSLSHLQSEPLDENIVAFWVFLKWANLVKDRFSSADYPAQVMFTNNEKNYEIVVCTGNGLNEIGHIMGRKKPFISTKYIIVFLDPKAYFELDKSRLEGYDFLFATFSYNPGDGKPSILYHDVIKQ